MFGKKENAWYAQFFQDLNRQSILDIATLNYDTTIERILPDLNNGFEDCGFNFKRFNPILIAEHSNTAGRLLHMHGCLNFGYSQTPNINKFVMEDDHEDLYLYQDYITAKRTWFGRSGNTSQSGERATIGPLITGLSKTDKLQAFPYIYYNIALAEAIRKNPAPQHAYLVLNSCTVQLDPENQYCF